jgi:hypothetical protein
VAVIAALGLLPIPAKGEPDTQNIDIATLGDLGLIDAVLYEGAYKFGDFAFEESARVGSLPSDIHNHYGLTLRGDEIARAVFRRSEDLWLSNKHEQQYLRLVLVQQFQHKRSVTMLPKSNVDTEQFAIRVTPKNAATQAIKDDWKTSACARAFSVRLRKLLLCAEQAYDIQLQGRQLSDGETRA